MSERKKALPGPEARSWTRVVIEGLRRDCEEVAAFLTDLTGDGVECMPVDAGTYPPRERVLGYLGDDALYPLQKKRLENFLRDFRKSHPETAPLLVRSEPLLEEDWQHTWRDHFRTTRLTARLTVKPPWEDYTPEGDERVIEIEPGMAFGTGLHASTRLVMECIEEIYPAGGNGPRSVLDVGTGTGILAIAAAMLGARQVLAVDNDDQAVRAARGNVERNGLRGTVTVRRREGEAVRGSFDLITANLYHNALRDLAPVLRGRLSAGGRLILSGLLRGVQEESLRKVCRRVGLSFSASRCREEWTALVFTA